MRAHRWALVGVAVAAVAVPVSAASVRLARVPTVTGRSFVILDPATNTILAERRPDLRLPMASTTKLMTALVAVTHRSLNARVRVSSSAAGTPGSSMGLVAGERVTIRELLEGLIIASGNDAAVAIADAVGGSVPHFAILMNREARALRLTDTHYANPDGLDAAHHFTSARDLVRLGRVVAAIRPLAAILHMRRAVVPGPDGRGRRVLISQDGALTTWAPIDIIKTGSTALARKTIVCLVVAPGTHAQIWIAELAAPSVAARTRDVERLARWAFHHFARRTVLAQGTAEGAIPVAGESDVLVHVTVAQSLTSVIRIDLPVSQTINLPDIVPAPVQAGQVLGRITVRQGARIIGVRTLTAAAAVPAVG
jgi:D-alanyl-D-alanine carboxypeptidase